MGLTNGIRIELDHQGTQVVGVHAGISTPRWPGSWPGRAEDQPRRHCPAGSNAVEAGAVEVLADDATRRIKSLLPDDHERSTRASRPPGTPATRPPEPAAPRQNAT